MKKFFAEFKKFISRGNVVDMAIGVIIANAFTAIVTSLTNKIITPAINWLLSIIVGGKGLDSVFTFLKKAYTVDGSGNTVIDLANSIYIDWGSLITAIINFFLIAFVLFCILKAFNGMGEGFKKFKKDMPNKEERKKLKAMGVSMKDTKTVIAKTAQIRAEAKAVADAEAQKNKKPTTDELLAEILKELKSQNLPAVLSPDVSTDVLKDGAPVVTESAKNQSDVLDNERKKVDDK